MCIFWADCAKSISIPNEKAPATGRGFSAAPGTPAVSKTRTCGEQDAHRVCGCTQPRTHAVGSGCRPTLSFCFPGRGEIPRLRRASHAAAPSKTRTGFVPAPSLARTRLVPSAGPRTAPVFSGREKAWLLFPAVGQKPEPNFHEYVKRGAKRSPTHRNARKAGALLLGFSGVSLPAGGLRPNGRTKPASSEKKGVSSLRAQASPFAQKRLKS